MQAQYTETDCTFEHAGQTFEAGGAVVTPEYVVGYVKGDTIINWHGDKVLGRVTRDRSWRTPYSFVSSRMHQITARIEGVLYTGRSGGDGMIWRGKRCAGQAVAS